MKRPLPKMLMASLLLSLAACASTATQAPRAIAPVDTAKKVVGAPTPVSMPAEDVKWTFSL